MAQEPWNAQRSHLSSVRRQTAPAQGPLGLADQTGSGRLVACWYCGPRPGFWRPFSPFLARMVSMLTVTGRSSSVRGPTSSAAGQRAPCCGEKPGDRYPAGLARRELRQR